MIRNYFKIAFRNLIKNPFLGSLNILGLSIGIAFVFLIFNYVWGEISVNRSLKNIDNQYIIQSNWTDKNEGVELTSYGQMAKDLRTYYPHLVTNYYRFDGVTVGLNIAEKNFRDGLQIGDSTLLKMFGFKLLYGDSKTALSEPYSLVLTEEKAIKYFGETNVVGKSISIESFSGSKHDFLITGVLAPFYRNSVSSLLDDTPNGLFVNNLNLQFFGRNMDWNNAYIVNFVELQPKVSQSAIQKAMVDLAKKNVPDLSQRMTPYLSNLQEYYLISNKGLIKKMILALSLIGLFILVMALVNFINLSISRSTFRMKEIGLRKTLGSKKRQMVSLFLAESYLSVIVSMALSFPIYYLSKGYFEQIVSRELIPFMDLPKYFMLFPIVIILIIGLLSGIYPAFVLSSLKVIGTLKGKLPNIRGNTLLRKSLITFQYVLASVSLVGAYIISQQIDLFLNQDLGYNKNFVVSAQVPRDWSPAGAKKMLSNRNQFSDLPAIESVSLSYEIPNGNNGGNASIFKYGTDSSKSTVAQILRSDERFLSVYEIPMKSGAYFNGNGLDSSFIVVNETASKTLGFNKPENAIGQKIRLAGDPTVFKIKGICNDFHFGSKQQKVAPIVIFNVEFSNIYRFLSFKLKQGNLKENIANLEKKWAQIMPGTAFEYTFMDDALAKLYKSEIQLRKASTLATYLALVIVLLGIIGMISISLQQRLKEIGIRKVLGSSIVEIILLFLKEFLIILTIAIVISSPMAYWIMHNWLETYAYHIDINLMPFVFSFSIMAFLSIILIGIQTFKSALMNPVKSLKSE